MIQSKLKEYEAQFFRYMVRLATHSSIKPLVIWNDYEGTVTFEFCMPQEYMYTDGGSYAKAAALSMPQVVLTPKEYDK